jgi:hypothetical protein
MRKKLLIKEEIKVALRKLIKEGVTKKADFQSIGLGGVNEPTDVEHILTLFSDPKVGFADEIEKIKTECSPENDYTEIGECQKFQDFIGKYQREQVFPSGFSDSRIDPNRETITMLYNTILGTNAEPKEETPEANEETPEAKAETPEAKVKLSGNKYENIAIKKYGNEFVDKVKSIGESVGLDYKMILAIMYFESGINHKAVNSQSKATGLIQFMPSTAQALGTTIGELRSMTALKQLDYVKKFFYLNRSLIPYIKSPEDAYFLVFYPLAAKKDDNFILGSEISDKRARLIAKQNPVDTNKDGVLSKGEVKAKVRQRLGI